MIHLYPELVLSIGNPLHFKKNALYLSVIVFSTKVLRLLLETGPLFFYVVIQATQRSNHLQGKGSTFISQLFEDPVSNQSGNQTHNLSLSSQVLYQLS